MQDVTHRQLVAAKRRNHRLHKLLGPGFGMFATKRAVAADLKRMAVQEKANDMDTDRHKKTGNLTTEGGRRGFDMRAANQYH